MMKATTTLFQPVGPDELKLIEALGWRAFPPQRDGRPVFTPALTQRYAEEVAAAWNLANSGAGYVVAAEIDRDVVEHYPEQVVGEAWQRELWVPTEDLGQLNRGLVGRMHVVAAFVAVGDRV
jgi:hypothetical protein